MPPIIFHSNDGKYGVVIYSDLITVFGDKIIKKFETKRQSYIQFFNNWLFISFRGSSSSSQHYKILLILILKMLY